MFGGMNKLIGILGAGLSGAYGGGNSLLPLLYLSGLRNKNAAGANATQNALPGTTLPPNYLLNNQAQQQQQPQPNLYPNSMNFLMGNNTNMPQQQTTAMPPYASPTTSLPQDKAELLNTLKQNAAAAYPDNPIMQQVAITQAIEESNLMGKPSQLAMKSNNLFGIKSAGTAGTANYPTTEYSNGVPSTVNAAFGANNSIADSFMQHRDLMNRLSRYQPVLNAADPVSAFQALQKAGYATDPNYARQLASIYNQYVAPLFASSY